MSAAAARPGIDLTPAHLIGLRGLVMAPRPRDRSGSPSFGGQRVNRAGKGQEVFDLRAYVEGDDARHIDHRASARRGTPFIRRFHEERSAPLVLVADLRASMAFGLRRAFRSFAACEVLTLMGWHRIRTRGQVGLYAVTSAEALFLPPRPRDVAMLRVIGGLAQLHGAMLAEAADGDVPAPLDRRLAGLDRLVRPGISVVLASSFDAPGAALDAELARIRARASLRLLQLTDGAAASERRGLFPVRDGGRGVTVLDRLPPPPAPPGFDEAHGDRRVDAGAEPVTLNRMAAA